jgi:hypothetical protein
MVGKEQSQADNSPVADSPGFPPFRLIGCHAILGLLFPLFRCILGCHMVAKGSRA